MYAAPMVLLILINAISIFGYATFVLHPDLLAQYPWSIPIFSVSFKVFAQLQIIIAFILFAFRCSKDLNRKWLYCLATAIGISFIMEYCGTVYGLPFGKYMYTSLLGAKIAGQVPVLIPLSWFFMSLPSYMIADQILGASRFRFSRVILGSILLLTWDLTLDPAMSGLTAFWVWENPGQFPLMMPAGNLLGWFITGILILGLYEFIGIKIPQKWQKNQFPLKFYAANLLLPLGLSIAGQLWFSIVATMLVFLFCAWVSFFTGGSRNFLRSGGV